MSTHVGFVWPPSGQVRTRFLSIITQKIILSISPGSCCLWSLISRSSPRRTRVVLSPLIKQLKNRTNNRTTKQQRDARDTPAAKRRDGSNNPWGEDHNESLACHLWQWFSQAISCSNVYFNLMLSKIIPPYQHLTCPFETRPLRDHIPSTRK